MKARILSATLTLLLTAPFLMPSVALAGDRATVIFKSGQVVMLEDGFRQIVDAMKNVKDTAENSLIEFNLNGGAFILNVAQVVVVCRDSCSSLKIIHQLDPKRTPANN